MTEAKFEKKHLTPKSKNISDWYTDVIQLAGLADYGPARGTMVFRPYGWAIWENIQKEFDKRIKKMGVENAYFPLFIPMGLLKKEKEHIEGFSPELAVVTYGGGKKLVEPLAVRPTSETIMYEMYAKWISSWRDLPLKINQWNNIVRWEKRTYFFLRTLEFLWQEGHTAHATYEEAEKMALAALVNYQDFYEKIYALPVTIGIKSEAEKFAGADHTYTVELLMPDGKALQGATSHHLGDNFSKVFNIKFQDREGKIKYVYQTSWGLSTRSIGGLILVHGDDKGLVLPPKLAPIKVAILPIFGKKDKEILRYCEKVKSEIEKKISDFPGEVKIYADSEKSYGWRVNETELQGIPLRISVGTREFYDKTVTLNFRLEAVSAKLFRLEGLKDKIEEMLSLVQKQMCSRAEKFLNENIRQAKDYRQFKKIMKSQRGFIKALWCENPACEAKIKEETKASIRLLPINSKETESLPAGRQGQCICCGKSAKHIWYFAQAY